MSSESRAKHHLTVSVGELTLVDLRCVYADPMTVSLDPGCFDAIGRARQNVLDVVAAHRAVYGVNTGL